MRVILSEAKDLTHEAWTTHIWGRDHWSLREIPRRLRGSG